MRVTWFANIPTSIQSGSLMGSILCLEVLCGELGHLSISKVEIHLHNKKMFTLSLHLFRSSKTKEFVLVKIDPEA
jgi:hypothetical protein